MADRAGGDAHPHLVRAAGGARLDVLDDERLAEAVADGCLHGADSTDRPLRRVRRRRMRAAAARPARDDGRDVVDLARRPCRDAARAATTSWAATCALLRIRVPSQDKTRATRSTHRGSASDEFPAPATVYVPRMSTTPDRCDRTAASTARGGPARRRGRLRPAASSRTARELHAHCYRMLGSVHDAEDALQDALLRAWRGLPRFEARSSLRAWLYRIATNACLNADRAPARADAADGVRPGRAIRTQRTSLRLAEPIWIEPYPDAHLGLGGGLPHRRRATSSARVSSWRSWRRSSCSRRASARR